jgi:hypothetical protein
MDGLLCRTKWMMIRSWPVPCRWRLCKQSLDYAKGQWIWDSRCGKPIGRSSTDGSIGKNTYSVNDGRGIHVECFNRSPSIKIDHVLIWISFISSILRAFGVVDHQMHDYYSSHRTSWPWIRQSNVNFHFSWTEFMSDFEIKHLMIHHP